MSSMKRTSTPLLPGEADEVEDLVVVDAPDDDGVDLDRGEPGRPGGVEAGEDAVEARPPGDRFEAVPAERVQADRHPREPGRLEARPRIRPGAGRWSSGPGRRVRAGPAAPRARATPRRASGSPPVSRKRRTPGGHGRAGHGGDLLVAQHVGHRHERHPRLGHAVDAAQVAAVGDRDAQDLTVFQSRLRGGPCRRSGPRRRCPGRA